MMANRLEVEFIQNPDVEPDYQKEDVKDSYIHKRFIHNLGIIKNYTARLAINTSKIFLIIFLFHNIEVESEYNSMLEQQNIRTLQVDDKLKEVILRSLANDPR